MASVMLVLTVIIGNSRKWLGEQRRESDEQVCGLESAASMSSHIHSVIENSNIIFSVQGQSFPSCMQLHSSI